MAKKTVKSPVASPGFSVMFSMRIQLLNTTAQAFTTSESKQTVQKNAVYVSRGDAAKGEGVLEIPDRATNAENSGTPIRNTAKTSTTAHFESRSLMATPSTILTARSQVKHERSLAKIQFEIDNFFRCIKYTVLHERTVTRAFISTSWLLMEQSLQVSTVAG